MVRMLVEIPTTESCVLPLGYGGYFEKRRDPSPMDRSFIEYSLGVSTLENKKPSKEARNASGDGGTKPSEATHKACLIILQSICTD